MFYAFPHRWLAALVLLGSAVAQAQTTLPYRSAFDGYQPFADSKLKPWKESNDAVMQAGGWRAYAKEAAAPSATTTAAGQRHADAEHQSANNIRKPGDVRAGVKRFGQIDQISCVKSLRAEHRNRHRQHPHAHTRVVAHVDDI